MNTVFSCLVRESAIELLYQERRSDLAVNRDKLKMLYLIRTEQSHSKVSLAGLLGRNRNTIAAWIDLYLIGGLELLLSRSDNLGGRPCKIHLVAREALFDKLDTPTGFRSYKEIALWLRDTYGILVVPKRLYYYLQKIKASSKVARPRSIGQDKEFVENFKVHFSVLIQSYLQDPNLLCRYKGVKLWFQDESKFQDAVVQRRKITKRGRKPIGLTRKSGNNFYIYGSFNPFDGQSFCQYFETVNTDSFDQYLNALSLGYLDYLNIIIVDRAPFHATKELLTPKNIQLVFLPPQSPELNPAERVWLELKNQMSWQVMNLSEIKATVRVNLDSLSTSQIKSLSHYPYIRELGTVLEREGSSPTRQTKLSYDLYQNIRVLLKNTPETITSGRPPKLSPEITSELIDLYHSKELTIAQILQKYDISKSLLYKIVKIEKVG